MKQCRVRLCLGYAGEDGLCVRCRMAKELVEALRSIWAFGGNLTAKDAEEMVEGAETVLDKWSAEVFELEREVE